MYLVDSVAPPEMNVESSRSHLIISIMLESRNLANGSLTFGKLNLVDLAGSERAARTGAKDDQLKVLVMSHELTGIYLAVLIPEIVLQLWR